jgi:protease IV
VNKALQIAAGKAKLSNYRIVELPKQEDPLTTFFNDFSTHIRNSIIKSELGSEQAVYYNIKQMVNRKGILTRMPYDLSIY